MLICAIPSNIIIIIIIIVIITVYVFSELVRTVSYLVRVVMILLLSDICYKRLCVGD